MRFKIRGLRKMRKPRIQSHLKTKFYNDLKRVIFNY